VGPPRERENASPPLLSRLRVLLREWLERLLDLGERRLRRGEAERRRGERDLERLLDLFLLYDTRKFCQMIFVVNNKRQLPTSPLRLSGSQ